MPTLHHNDLTLTYGWDAPLQYFYLTVERGKHLVYCNMDDPDATVGTYGGGLTLMQLQTQLSAHGVTLEPAELDALAGHTPASSPRAPGVQALMEFLNKP